MKNLKKEKKEKKKKGLVKFNKNSLDLVWSLIFSKIYIYLFICMRNLLNYFHLYAFIVYTFTFIQIDSIEKINMKFFSKYILEIYKEFFFFFVILEISR